jgi:ubiquinone/menaquinone biosynthesis C-methylase UbiE
MSTEKTEKELAYLHDLFVAPDWDERFASLIDDHVKLPKEGHIVYLGAGTGGHAITIKQRGGDKLALRGFDENRERVELAKAKATLAKEMVEFEHSTLESLPVADNHSDLVIGNASLVSVERLKDVVADMVRVAKPGATVVLALATASSFAEFFSVYWEALHNLGFIDHEGDVEKLITEAPTVSDAEDLVQNQGLDDVTSMTQLEEFDFDSGESFLRAPLIADFLLKSWLSSLREDQRSAVSREVARIINDDRHDAEFALTVKATLIVGRKGRPN